MKKTILVLLAFLVFASLSCQKENGVESAGKGPSNKNDLINNVRDNNLTQCPEDINCSYEVIMNLYECDNGKPGNQVFQYSYHSTEYQVSTPVCSTYVTSAYYNGQYALEVIFKWNNCAAHCDYSYYNTSASGRVAIFNILKDGDVIFGTLLSKPYGSPSGTGLVSGEDSFLYSPLVNTNIQLEPDTEYGFQAHWAWCPAPTK